MASVSVKSSSGSDAGSIDLDEAIFGIEPNIPCMHQVVTAQLAAKRSGTQSTQTRAEARGGGAKPWKQKGTGRARQGSIRAPQWRGGGVALGPKPRSYAQRTPKKMIRLALRSALSDRAAENQVIVLDGWGFDAPSTKAAAALLEAVGATGRVLVVLSGEDLVAWKSFRNLANVHLLEAGQLNAYDVLVSDFVVFTRDTLPSTDGEAPAKPKAVREPKPKVVATPKPKPAPAAAAPAAEPAPADAVATDIDGSSDASPEADDMGDLPNRPAADPSKKTAPIEATDRVKSAADKPDPRFEAARQKAAKEDALRAKAADIAESRAADEAAADDGEAADDESPKKAGSGFSFSNTTEDE